jgi:hypothetical protein
MSPLSEPRFPKFRILEQRDKLTQSLFRAQKLRRKAGQDSGEMKQALAIKEMEKEAAAKKRGMSFSVAHFLHRQIADHLLLPFCPFSHSVATT